MTITFTFHLGFVFYYSSGIGGDSFGVSSNSSLLGGRGSYLYRSLEKRVALFFHYVLVIVVVTLCRLQFIRLYLQLPWLIYRGGGGAGQPFLDSTTLFHEGDSLPIDSIGYTAKNEMEQIGTWTGRQVLI